MSEAPYRVEFTGLISSLPTLLKNTEVEFPLNGNDLQQDNYIIPPLGQQSSKLLSFSHIKWLTK